MLPQTFFQKDALTLAVELLGCELVHTTDKGSTAGIITETEAYRQDDEASHSFRGKTLRNAAMFGPAGHAYIYFTYGMHYCFNIVAGNGTMAEAVLIRALEPTAGVDLMQMRRGITDPHNLCSGPAKLVQAMGLLSEHNGSSLTADRLHLKPRATKPPVAVSPRIGIRNAIDKPWRFFVAGSPYVTKHKFNTRAAPLEDEPSTHLKT